MAFNKYLMPLDRNSLNRIKVFFSLASFLINNGITIDKSIFLKLISKYRSTGSNYVYVEDLIFSALENDPIKNVKRNYFSDFESYIHEISTIFGESEAVEEIEYMLEIFTQSISSDELCDFINDLSPQILNTTNFSAARITRKLNKALAKFNFNANDLLYADLKLISFNTPIFDNSVSSLSHNLNFLYLLLHGCLSYRAYPLLYTTSKKETVYKEYNNRIYVALRCDMVACDHSPYDRICGGDDDELNDYLTFCFDVLLNILTNTNTDDIKNRIINYITS